jgi:hypothetical protein
MGGVDPSIDQAPHRGRRRGRPEDVLGVPAPLPDTVEAIRSAGDRGGQINEHHTRGVLAVTEDDDVGVIGVDDDALMRTPRSPVASGALVISVTGSSPR